MNHYEFLRKIGRKFGADVDYWLPVVPKDTRKILDSTLIYSNLYRIRLITWPLIITQLFIGPLIAKNTPHYYGLAANLTMIAGLLFFLAAVRLPASPEGITRRHKFFDNFMFPFILGIYAIYSILFFSDSLPVKYITPVMGTVIAMFSTASFLYIKWHKSVLVYVTACVAIIVSGWVLLPNVIALAYSVNIIFVTVLSIIMSRIIYIMRIQDFLKQIVIDGQKEELIAANNMLHGLSYMDALTNIPNRRYFDEMLSREWGRAVRDKYELTLLMIDIDFFKQFNDNFGHQAGDDCLVKVAEALKKAVKRLPDMVARYGGEEFAVILPNTDTIGALQVAGSLCDAVRSLNIAHTYSPYGQLTISIGAACRQPGVGEQPESLIAAADDALYQAKLSGRNMFIGG